MKHISHFSLLISQLWALALNVWREAVRDKLIQLLVGFGFFMMLVAIVFGNMAVGGQKRVIEDMIFWIIGLWGLLAVLYMGSAIVKKELQSKTVYLVLSRPISRPVFLTGKFFGMILVLLSVFSLLSIAGAMILQIKGIAISINHLWTVVFIFGEWIMMAALSLFFASFTTPILHNFFLVGVNFLGHYSNDLLIYAENTKDFILKLFLTILYYVLPNLELYNFREKTLYKDIIESAALMHGAAILSGWILVFLIAANLIFVRRRLL